MEYYTGMKSKGATSLSAFNTFSNISSGREENRFQSGREILCFIWFLVYIPHIPHVFLHEEKSGSMNAKMLIILTSGYEI